MTRFYNGAPSVKQLPFTKENYKGKNLRGGRKAVFSQSKEYKSFVPHAIRWSWQRDPLNSMYQK